MVALTAPAIKVSHNGTRTGGEIWSTGHWVAAPAGVTQSDLDTFCNSVATDFSAFLTARTGDASVDTRYTDTKCTYYPAGSLTASLLSDNLLHAQSMTGSIGSSHPYDNAVVASLRTAIPSRRTRGRMYLPLNAVAMASGGQYDGTRIGFIASAFKAYLQAVNGHSIAGSPAQVVVASHTSGLQTQVTQLVVDSLPDTQRRRDNRLQAATVAVQAI